MDKLVEKINKGAHSLVYPYDILPQPGRMLKIDDGVYWVRMSLPFALDHINLWVLKDNDGWVIVCLLYTSPSPRDSCASRMPSSA